jgi:hypothetical protein
MNIDPFIKQSLIEAGIFNKFNRGIGLVERTTKKIKSGTYTAYREIESLLRSDNWRLLDTKNGEYEFLKLDEVQIHLLEVHPQLDKKKDELLKRVQPLIAKKKKLYSKIDITSPKSSDEKKLDKEIADLFSQINQINIQKRKMKTEITEGKFADIVKKAEIAHSKGNTKLAKYHLDNARTFMLGLKSIEVGKNKEFINKYNEMRKQYNESLSEGIWPKSKLKSDRFEFELSSELKKNFKGIFYVIGHDLYHNDKKVMTIDGDRDSINSIIKKLKSKINESVNESVKYQKGKLNQSGNGWSVYKFDDLIHFDIKVNQSARWSTDVHDSKGETIKLMDAGKKRATLRFKEGNINNFAEQMYKLNDETTWGEKQGLTAKDYADVLRVWIDMKIYNNSITTESITETNQDPHIKKVGKDYYVDSRFVQHSNQFGTLKHIWGGEFTLETPDGDVQFWRSSKSFPDFVGRSHKIEGDEKAIKRVVVGMIKKHRLKESMNESYTGNSGDKLTHKYDKNIEIELIEPTNKGWKVYQTDKGRKRKIAYFDKQDIVGNKALFESVNEEKNWKTVSFEEFYKDTVLSYPSRGWDKNGDALVDITLKSKPMAKFDYKYSVKSVKLDDYIKDRKLRLPIQIKQTIYDKFYNKLKESVNESSG